MKELYEVFPQYKRTIICALKHKYDYIPGPWAIEDGKVLKAVCIYCGHKKYERVRESTKFVY